MACCPMLYHNLPTLSTTRHLVQCCFKRCPPYRQHRSLVQNPYLSTVFPTVVRNSHLSTVFPCLTGNSQLTSTFSILVQNFVLRANIPTLVGNSHLSSVFPTLVRNFQLSTDFCTLTGIYASSPMMACYLQRGSLPDVVPKFTRLIKKMPTHCISCLNPANLFKRQRLVRCCDSLCPAYRQHRHLSRAWKSPRKIRSSGGRPVFSFFAILTISHTERAIPCKNMQRFKNLLL